MILKKCSFEGCDKKLLALKLCSGHYAQQYSGNPLTPIRKYDPNKKCSFGGCDRKYMARNLCNAHYGQQNRGMQLAPLRLYRIGPLQPKEVPKELRRAFNFKHQVTKKTGTNYLSWWIQRICTQCGKQKEIPLKRILASLKNGSFTGKCFPCSALCGTSHPSWRGGRLYDKSGYIRIYTPNHPSYAQTTNYVLEHRLVMEKKIGRYLSSHETVHHINGIKNDNRPENLELWIGSQPTGIRAEDAPHCPTCVCNTHPSEEDLKEAQEKVFTSSLP